MERQHRQKRIIYVNKLFQMIRETFFPIHHFTKNGLKTFVQRTAFRSINLNEWEWKRKPYSMSLPNGSALEYDFSHLLELSSVNRKVNGAHAPLSFSLVQFGVRLAHHLCYSLYNKYKWILNMENVQQILAIIGTDEIRKTKTKTTMINSFEFVQRTNLMAAMIIAVKVEIFTG